VKYLKMAIKSLLLKHGYKTDDLPTGVNIGVCQVEDCLIVMGKSYQ
jgi:activating signal cointegrator 1